MVLLTAVVLYPRLYNQLPTVSPSESVGAVQQFRAAHLACILLHLFMFIYIYICIDLI
jgi:hypothetical protein